jgi:iron complex outermembrane receptor protein
MQNSSYRVENKVSGAPDQVVTDADAKMISFVSKFLYRYQFGESISLITGLDASLQGVDSENKVQSAPVTGYNKNRVENSLHAMLETTLSDRWSAVFLLREELIDMSHAALLPLLRLSFRPDPLKSLVVSGSVSGNSHPPTLNDLYFIPGGNPLLRSEKGTLYDLGATDDFAFGSNRIHAGISLFSSVVSDWIIWLPTFQGYWEPGNIEKVKSSGIETSAGWNGRFKSLDFGIKGNYAYTSTVNLSENSPAYGKQLPYIPKHSANVNTHLSWSRFQADWMWNYYSKRFTTTANSEETLSDYIYPYFMNNLQFSATFPVKTNKLTAECKILNLFDEEYRTVLQRPMPGRNYQFVLRYDF